MSINVPATNSGEYIYYRGTGTTSDDYVYIPISNNEEVWCVDSNDYIMSVEGHVRGNKNASGGIFNNGAQVWNHTFYFMQFSAGGCELPKGNLKDAIEGWLDVANERQMAQSTDQINASRYSTDN